MIAHMTLPMEISGWKPAPFALGGETVFAVGDVHGCAEELRALLRAIAILAREGEGRRSLVYLGDLIDRGPDTVGTLKLWAEDATHRGVDRVERIIGNHEIMMLLALAGGPPAHKATAMWRSEAAGGEIEQRTPEQAVEQHHEDAHHHHPQHHPCFLPPRLVRRVSGLAGQGVLLFRGARLGVAALGVGRRLL